MKLFNTMTNQKEEFVPLHEGEVSMYVCGPTVYNYVHIGNTRPMITFDVLRRVFEYRGYNVRYASNFTDVDDKIIKQAKQEGVTEKELTEKYIAAYEAVREGLNCEQPTYQPKVTETMDRIIAFISDLVEKGAAYEVDGDVYFRVPNIDDYGCLSGIKVEDLVEGASERVSETDKKESSLDFALWKKTDDGIQWDSPWSKGRPGWHTECVVMINDRFEDGKIDIHGGGHDLKFPHHENEIAQSEAYHDHKIANYWMHNQMINIDNQKMSKSLGNVKWAKDLLEELGVNVYRWLMLSTHYRNPLNFTDAVVQNVKKEVAKVQTVLNQASLYLQTHNGSIHADYDKCAVDVVAQNLEDDLNTSNALTTILDQVKLLNTSLRTKEKNNDLIANQYASLMKMTDLVGFKFEVKELNDEEIELYQQWEAYKANKDFENADVVRKTLISKGVL